MNLRHSRIVVVNDDGIDAHGLSVLEQAARKHSDDVWVVAPASDQSGRGRAMSYRQEVRVTPRGDKRFAVEGTPADCVIVALNGMLTDRRVDLIISGINNGENVADDVASSGTVGACLEGADQDVPGIAFSQAWDGSGAANWACSHALAADVLPTLAAALSDPRMVLNVNFPALEDPGKVAGCRVVHTGWRVGPTTLEERPTDADDDRIFHIESLREDRPNEPDCDLDLIQQGYLTVTPLTLDQTNYSAMQSTGDRLKGLLG